MRLFSYAWWRTGLCLIAAVFPPAVHGQSSSLGSAASPASAVSATQQIAPSGAAIRTDSQGLNSQGLEALGLGDQLTLNIPDLDEVRNISVRVASDGSLDLPLIGTVPVSGSTLPQLRQTLAARYSKFINNPQIALQVTSSQNRTISILGEVNSPGVQEITGPLTLLGAISKAGGIRPDAGPHVIVTRTEVSGRLPLPTSMVTSVDGHLRAAIPLDELLAERAPQNNIQLQAGDVVTIPKGSIVYVVGEVHRAGGFPLRSSGHVSLIEALALAEGLGPNAKSSGAKILRLDSAAGDSRKEIPVNIGEILAGKKPDPQLIADDILFVPGSAAKTGARRAAEAILQVTTGILIYR